MVVYPFLPGGKHQSVQLAHRSIFLSTKQECSVSESENAKMVKDNVLHVFTLDLFFDFICIQTKT